MAKPTRKLDVFISYSRDDLEFADQLDAALDGTGFNATLTGTVSRARKSGSAA